MSQVSFTEPPQWVWYICSICVCGVCVCTRAHSCMHLCGEVKDKCLPQSLSTYFFFYVGLPLSRRLAD